MILFKRWPLRKEAEEGEEGGGGTGVDDKPVETAKEPEIDPETLAKAEKMGWTPRSEYKGDPAKWRSAEEWVQRGENMLPILQAHVRKQDRQIAELTSTVKEFAEYASKSEQRAMDKALTQLRQERADAIAKGDGVAFDKIDGEIADLKKKAEAKTTKPKDDSDPVFDEWLGRNKWAEDPKMQRVGRAIAESLIEDGEKAIGTELLDLVTKEMRQRYPEKFENARRNAAPTVEGGAGPRRSGGKSFADMPAEARNACERMAKNGYTDAKQAAEFKAQYVKQYFEEA